MLKVMTGFVIQKIRAQHVILRSDLIIECTQELHPRGYTHKQMNNVRRRVYEVLNILEATGVISLNGCGIIWRGIPTPGPNIKDAEIKRDLMHSRIEQKRRYMDDLSNKVQLYRSIVERNKSSYDEQNAQKVYLPFVVIHTTNDCSVNCDISNDKSQYDFQFSKPFRIYEDQEILRAILNV